ncbi:hypothetical protein CHS0354_018124 [Potamilus streckersoni]|uniref:Glycine cleavage system H protein n=1 Tax=Potamilus streckersoni TaxID=2493646 RepID=A0AAE0W208_9BIVA|nr:hypothetical protein CHS0354_018124 [Potamilus streckersoni]
MASLLKHAVFQSVRRFPALQVNGIRCISITPFNLQKYFSEKHEYVDVKDEGGKKVGTVGITDYAQDKLGEVVYVQLPEVGCQLEMEGEAGVLESVKAASEVFSPVSGIVTAVNPNHADKPNLVNESPYDKGWLFKIKLSEPEELKKLMNEETYLAYIKTIE